MSRIGPGLAIAAALVGAAAFAATPAAFGSPQPGYTTGELARHLAARGEARPDDVTALRGILEACDLTKFARRPYDAARAHEAETTAARLIET